MLWVAAFTAQWIQCSAWCHIVSFIDCVTNAWHLFGFCHYNPRILNLHQPDNESRAEDMKHCLQREEGTGIPWNAQCGYGVLLFLFTTSQAEHKQLGFPWSVDLEVWTEVAEGMTLGMPLFLSLSHKYLSSLHSPKSKAPSPGQLHTTSWWPKAHLESAPHFLSYHCDSLSSSPSRGKPLSKHEELQLVGPSPPWPHPASSAPFTNPQLAARLPPNAWEASGSLYWCQKAVPLECKLLISPKSMLNVSYPITK